MSAIPTGARVEVRGVSGTRAGTIAGTDPGHYMATVHGATVYLVQFDDSPPDRPGSGWRRHDFTRVLLPGADKWTLP